MTVQGGYSLGEIMRTLLPVDVSNSADDTYSFVQIVTTDGTPPIIIPAAEVTKSASASPPVIWDDSQGLNFLEPEEDGTPGRITVIGEFDSLYICLHNQGAILSVAAPTAAHKVAVDQSVHFTSAGVTNPPAGVGLTYNWEFGDGSGGTGLTASHTYSLPGTYDAYLEVYGNDGQGDLPFDGSLGVSETVTVRVGPPPPPTKTHRSGSGRNKQETAPVAGPSVKGSISPVGTGRPGAARPPQAASTQLATRTAPVTVTRPDLSPIHRRIARSALPLLSGIVIGSTSASPIAPNRQSKTRVGVTDPARTGRLRPGEGWGGWVILAALATLAIGAISEWTTPRRVARFGGHEGQLG